jgi:hypothetical protein
MSVFPQFHEYTNIVSNEEYFNYLCSHAKFKMSTQVLQFQNFAKATFWCTGKNSDHEHFLQILKNIQSIYHTKYMVVHPEYNLHYLDIKHNLHVKKYVLRSNTCNLCPSINVTDYCIIVIFGLGK